MECPPTEGQGLYSGVINDTALGHLSHLNLKHLGHWWQILGQSGASEGETGLTPFLTAHAPIAVQLCFLAVHF